MGQLLVGVDSYSYHRFLGELRVGEPPVLERWSHEQLLDEVIDSGAEVVSLETCFLPDQHRDVLVSTVARLRRSGVKVALAWGHPEGLAAGRDEAAMTEAMLLLADAAAAGVSLVRVVAGGPRQWRAEPEAVVIERLAPMLREVVDHAVDLRVDVAIETHAELSLRSFAELVERVGPPLGVVLDTGNIVRIGSSLADAVSVLGEHVVMVHAKDLSLRDVDVRTPPGGTWWYTAVGRGRLPIRRCLDQLVGLGFDGPVCVELTELDRHVETDERAAVRDSLEELRRWRVAA